MRPHSPHGEGWSQDAERIAQVHSHTARALPHRVLASWYCSRVAFRVSMGRAEPSLHMHRLICASQLLLTLLHFCNSYNKSNSRVLVLNIWGFCLLFCWSGVTGRVSLDLLGWPRVPCSPPPPGSQALGLQVRFSHTWSPRFH